MDGSGFPTGGSFVPPIFAPGGAQSVGSGSLGEHDIDDMFVDDFLSGGMFGEAPAPAPSHGFPPTSAAPPAPPSPLAAAPLAASSAVLAASAGQGGFSLLQRSAAAPADALHPNAATLASIASNPSTSRSVAEAALAASKAAAHIPLEGDAAVATQSGGGRSRRPSARAAASQRVTVTERGSTKRGLEASEMEGDDEEDQPGPKRKRSLNANERQARSRERNRVHARKSRLRKKFFVDSLKSNLTKLENENVLMRQFLKQHTGRTFEELVQGNGSSDGVARSAASVVPDAGLLAGSGRAATRQLENPDYKLVQALTVSQQNFVVTDPNLPDNPIVFASSGFYQLTGYSPGEVIGRNCRFLQGPGTDPVSIAAIRTGVAEGRDTATCLINYRKDGTPFWNQFFVAPLRGVDGRVVNFVGVQCEVSEAIAKKSLAAATMAAAHGAVPPTPGAMGAATDAATKLATAAVAASM